MLLSRPCLAPAVLGVLALYVLPAGAAEPEITRGQRVFQTQCAGCHAIEPDAHRAGPSLHGILGRPAGSVEQFDYSPAMQNADIVWTADKLDAFLENTEQVIPGTRMVFWGLNEEDRRLILRYFEHLAD